MVVRIALQPRNMMMDGLFNAFDTGLGPCYLEIRTGTQPADADTTATGTLLATLTLADPAFVGGSSVGQLVVDVSGPPSGTAVATGTAGWGRMYDFSDNPLIDGSVTDAAGGDFVISSTAITTSDLVELTDCTLDLPAS